MKVLLKNNSWAQGGKRRTLSDWQSTSRSLSLPFPSNPVCYSFPGCSWQSFKGTHIIGNSSMNSLRGWIIPMTAAGQQRAQPQTCWIKTCVHRASSRHSGEKPLPVLSEACWTLPLFWVCRCCVWAVVKVYLQSAEPSKSPFSICIVLGPSLILLRAGARGHSPVYRSFASSGPITAIKRC